jgi:hypothetical protein
MNKLVTAAVLSLASSVALAAPANLVVDNNTDFQARAYVKGISKNPAEPHSSLSINWSILNLICFYQATCEAEVKVKTDSNNPLFLGKVTMNMSSGAIDTSKLSQLEGFKVTYLSPGHVRIDKEG